MQHFFAEIPKISNKNASCLHTSQQGLLPIKNLPFPLIEKWEVIRKARTFGFVCQESAALQATWSLTSRDAILFCGAS